MKISNKTWSLLGLMLMLAGCLTVGNALATSAQAANVSDCAVEPVCQEAVAQEELPPAL